MMKWRMKTPKAPAEAEASRRHDAGGSRAGVFRPLGDFATPPPPRVTTEDDVGKKESVKEINGSKPGVFRLLGDFAPPPPSRTSIGGGGGKMGAISTPKGRDVVKGRPLGGFVPPPPPRKSTGDDKGKTESALSPKRNNLGSKQEVFRPLRDPVPPPPPRKSTGDGDGKALTPPATNTVAVGIPKFTATSKSEPMSNNSEVRPKKSPRTTGDNPLRISLPEPPPPTAFETVQIVVNPRVSSGASIAGAQVATSEAAPLAGGAVVGGSTMATFKVDSGGYTDLLEPRDRDEEIYENSPAFRLVPVTTNQGPGARLHETPYTNSTTIQLNGDLVSRVDVPSSEFDSRLTTTVVVTGEPDSRPYYESSSRVVSSEPGTRLNGSTIVIQSAPGLRTVGGINVKSDRDARLHGANNTTVPVTARLAPMIDDRLRLSPDSSLNTSPLSRTSSHCTEHSSGTGSTYNIPLPVTPLGSTDKLIAHAHSHAQFTPKNKFKVSSGWLPACGQVVTVLSLAVGFGNVFRLPRTVYLNGGGAFLFAYVMLTLVLGLPLVFLEMGLGQFCEEGVTKLYRAVPLFKGVGYVKVLSSVLLAVYYPILMALSLFYMIWSAKGPLPFAECNHTFIGEVVYHHTILGEECLQNTFLRPPKDDGMWFGVNVALMFLIWAVIMLCLFKHGASLRVATYVLSVPAVLCLIALLSESIVQDPNAVGLDNLLAINWDTLLDIKVWYFATIQMFFSTHLGLGNIVTSAGRLYPQSNVFWTAALFVVCNLLFGLLSVFLAYYWIGRLNTDMIDPRMPEVWLLTLLYDVANQALGEDRQVWAVIGYLGFLLAGFIAMVWLVFTILEVITIELGPRKSWEPWQRTGMVCAVGFLVGVPALLPYELELVHILDHYVIGRIVIATVILELIAIAWIYGCGTLYIDFEFILGYRLNPCWKLIWWVAPLLLMMVEVWSLVSLPLTGIAEQMPDPVWVFATGWTLYLSMWVIILITAVYQVSRQIDYNLAGRLLSTLKPSRKWGPQDTMYRHNWHQWRKQTVDGERDYTLKRRGTKDYTHSLKRPLHQATAGNTIRSVKQPYSIHVPYNEADHVCWRGHNDHT